jgi:hypothetical protein
MDLEKQYICTHTMCVCLCEINMHKRTKGCLQWAFRDNTLPQVVPRVDHCELQLKTGTGINQSLTKCVCTPTLNGHVGFQDVSIIENHT